MTIMERYSLGIIRSENNRSLIRKDGEEYWVKPEFLELDAKADDPNDWTDWLTEAYTY
jgi:hypothetical protein